MQERTAKFAKRFVSAGNLALNFVAGSIKAGRSRFDGPIFKPSNAVDLM